MIFYAQSGLCRWKLLLDYFGAEENFEACGTCDNCLHPPVVSEEPRESPLQVRRDETLKPGERVRLPNFGVGEITAIVGESVTVAFANGEQRTFLRSFVKPARR
jgi:ATP-dependent DNA helicase RecQ